MKPQIVLYVALLPGALLVAAPADAVIMAAMNLGEQRSYSWTASVTDDARTYEIAGKTARAGYTWVRLPMVEQIARRLGRAAEPDIEALFNGPENCVIRTDGQWVRVEDLPRRHPDWVEQNSWLSGHRSMILHHPGPGMGIGFNDPLDPFGNDPFASLLLLPPLPPEEEDRPYSNAQFALSHPHDELAVIVSSHATMNVRGKRAEGLLTDLGAQLLLVREGQDEIEPIVAAGRYELTVEDGVVTRYNLWLEGLLYVDRKRVHVRQSSQTTISGLGSTVVDVPADARRLLDGRRLLAGLEIRR